MDFFFYCRKHVENMNNKLSDLKKAEDNMQKKNNEALSNHKFTPDTLPPWLEKVETIIRETEKIPKGGNGCLNIKNRYKAGKSSFDLIEQIDDLLEQQDKITWSDKEIPLALVTSSTSSSTCQTDYDVIPNIFPSRTSIFNNVVKSLDPDNKTQLMALYGRGGVGKTTMMEEIKKFVEKKGKFQYVLWVSFGTKYDLVIIQKLIAKYMGVDLCEETKRAGAELLRISFEMKSEMGKKVLLILDDVWDAIDLNDIGLAGSFPKGFKLMITSRDKNVCTKMDIDEESIFEIHGLEKEDAESFFWKIAKNPNEDRELFQIAEDILKKCGGLPIAIKTIALALKGKKMDEWQVAQKNLQRHNLEGIDDLSKVVNEIFEISYSYLKKDEDKAIFVLCGLFPDDFNIDIEELVRYGWGLQFFKKADSLIEARKLTKISIRKLISSNLLTKSDTKGHVKMHDLVRDFVLINISKFKQASIVNHGNKSEWPTQDTHESCERLLLTCEGMSKFPKVFYYPNLALLKMMDANRLLDLPEDLNKRMEKLQVMAYERMRYPLHAQSLSYSTSLQTLCLVSCSLVDKDISFLGNLVNLEVLSLANCGICKLPYTIKKLKMLKLLDLTECRNLCIDDGVFQSLDKLEELYMGVFKPKSIRFSHANCEELQMISGKLNALEVEFFENALQPKCVSFDNLKRFRISMGCFLNLSGGDEYSFKNTLKLVTNSNDILECKINVLFSHTVKLHLSVKDMSNVGDISMSPTQHSTFCNLKFLHVFECEELTHLFTISMANGLKKLQRLTVSSCPLLKSIVSSCDGVNVLELPKLVELKLENLPNFTSIILENDIFGTPPLLNKKVVIPNLSKLEVNGLKKLEQIWAYDFTIDEEDNVLMLKKIKVNDCNSLVNLFPCNPMRLLTHLEELEISKCCSIEVIFNIDFGKTKQYTSNNSNLRRIRVVELEELREVWRINEEKQSGHLISGFQAVETIIIGRCRKFKNIFAPITTNFDMRALINISIEAHKVEDAKINGISKVDEDMSIVGFPSYHLTRTFNQIHKIDFKRIGGAEVLFEIQTPEEIVSSHQQQSLPLLPCLEDLTLFGMGSMSHVWKCNNWNKFFILQKNQPQSSFQNLTNIKLLECNGIKYLFSPLMSKLLSNLKNLHITFCEGIEEVVSNRDDDHVDDETLTSTTTTLFPFLDRLELSRLYNLKQIGGGVTKCSQMGFVPWSLCQYPTNIHIMFCPSLSTLIPSDAARQMQKLQEITLQECNGLKYLFSPLMSEVLYSLKTLEINDCKGIEEIISSRDDVNDDDDEALTSTTTTLFPCLYQLVLKGLPNLKQIGGGATKFSQMGIVPWSLCQYPTKIDIRDCPSLSSVIPSDAARQMQKLQELTIKNCKSMVEVFESNTNQGSVSFPTPKAITNFHYELTNLKRLKIVDCDLLEHIFTFSTLESLRKLEELSIWNCKAMKVIVREEHGEESSSKVVFPCLKLKSIELYDLPNLAGFFIGMNIDFEWRSLDYVMINDCPQMMLFTSGESIAPKLKYIHTRLGKHDLERGLNFRQTLPSSGDSVCPAALGATWSFHNLIEIDLKYDFEHKNVVPSNELQQLQILEKIHVSYSWVEEVFEVSNNESPTVVTFPKLREVELNCLSSLKYIWKSNEWSILEFPNLTTLSIFGCYKLEHVFTASMVGSLIKLQQLHVRECKELEVIVKKEGECCDDKVGKITFPCLKSLKLTNLKSLKGFWLGKDDLLFPSMNTLVIEGCPEIKNFNDGHAIAHELKLVETCFGVFQAEEDINSFIRNKIQEGFKFEEQKEFKFGYEPACIIM